MKQIITIILEKNNMIENIRKKYLKNSDKIKPHITLVYPFFIEDENKLKKHIFNVLEKFNKIELTLNGLEKSKKDYYLYLLVDKGKEEINKLYEKLNTGILSDFINPDMPKYIAHLSIGKFNSKEEINKAINEISKIDINFQTEINSIDLLTINDNNELMKKEKFNFN